MGRGRTPVSFIELLFLRPRTAPRRAEPTLGVETRDAGFAALSASLGAVYSATGPLSSISPARAEAVVAVQSCVNLIATSIGSLPTSLTQDGPNGPEPAPSSSAAWRILNRPNPRQSWPAFVSFFVSQLLLQGNALAAIETDARGAVSGLTPIPWPWINVVTIDDGASLRLAYDVMQHSAEVALLGIPKRLLDEDVVHCRMRGDAGIVGRSVLSRAASPIYEGIELAKVADATWRNGLRPSAVMKAPNFLTDVQRKRYEAEFRPSFQGSLNTGNVPLLEGGWDLQQTSMNSIDAQFLENRAFSVSDVCRLFNVPEPLLQLGQRAISDLAPFTTALAQFALSPIVTLLEHEFDHSILPSGQHLKIDLSGVMRGSFSATVAALAALKQSGIVTANDVRSELDWPPVQGGDVLTVNGAPVFPPDFTGSTGLHPSPGPTGDEAAQPGTHQNAGAGG
jgi:HK97 family phage portal protein